jgi:hypothetical protein
VVEFHDPRGEVAVEPEPYTLGIDIRNKPMTLGLLANGFPDSENFLSQVAGALTALVPGLEVKFWNKGNASVAASNEMLTDIAEGCDAAIAAYGH